MTAPRLLSLFVLVVLTHTAGAVPIGSRIDNLVFKDIRYLSRSLDDFKNRKAFVVVFTRIGCPLVPRYLPVLDRMEKAYRSKGVQFVAVNVGPDDTIVEMANQIVEIGVAFPAVKDFDGKCVAALGITRTPEVALLDGKRVLRYRGRIDDQYRPGVTRRAPTRHDLKEALDEILSGKEVSVPTTLADGCLITPADLTKPVKPITYARHVAPILAKHCAVCHKPETAAPFSLLTYEQARANGRMLAEVVREGRMPPWFAPSQHGPFVNSRALGTAERELVRLWVQAGMPPGDLTTLPPAKDAKAAKWQIDEPDLVLTTAAYDIPAIGDMPYQYAVLSRWFAEDTWVQGVQILPEKGRLVHHANLAHVSLSEGFKESNLVTGFVPGGGAMHLENGIGYKIPGGSVLVLQIHFVTNGKPEKCRVSVGIRYARGVVQQQLRHVRLATTRYAIPPGEPAHPVAAARVLQHDADGIGLFTHMHVRGKAMTFKAHTPDGKTETMLTIPNYSFDWQLAYRWAPRQKRLPKGTRLEAIALFDNSDFNPFNPDPTATVHDGPQTYQEMMNGYFFYVAAAERLNLTFDGAGRLKR